MKILKRILSGIITAAILCSGIVVAADTSNIYDRELDILKELEIYSPKGAKDDYITQEEFLELISSLNNSAFDEKYYTSMGVLPFSTGRYMPEDPITYADAVKTAVIITGYYFEAQSSGGFPNGYMSVADQYDISKGMKVADETKITKAETAKLIWNTLQVDILYVDKIYADGRASYNVTKDKNLLKTTFDICEVKGTVTATSNISIDPSVDTKENTVVINKTEFDAPDIETDSFIGLDVLGYYKIDDNDTEVLLYLEASNRNNVTELYCDDIISFGDYQYFYEGEKRNEYAAIEYDAAILYNEEYVKPQTGLSLNMIPYNGSVKLIDNNSNKKADVVLIFNYESYIAETINANKETIVLKDNKGRLEVNDDIRFTRKDDALSEEYEAGIEEISKNDVLSVLRGTDGKIKKIVITSTSVDGMVISVAKENNKVTITLDDGEKYEFINELTESASKIRIGYNITLLLDLYDKAAGFIMGTDNEMHFGYLVDIKYDEESEDTVNFIMYNIDIASRTDYLGAKKIKIDGVTYKRESVKYQLQPEGGTFKGCLIRYKLNSLNEIREIDTYVDNNNSLAKNKDEGLIRIYSSPILNTSTGVRQGFYYKKGILFEPVLKQQNSNESILYRWKEGFACDLSVKVVEIPENRKDFASYKISTVNSLREGVSIIEAYRVGNEKYSPSLMLMYKGDGVQIDGEVEVKNRTDLILETTVAKVVTNISQTLNDDDEIVYELTIFGTEGKNVLKTENSKLLDEFVTVEVGDVVRYATNSSNQIIGIEVTAKVNDILSGGYESNNGVKGNSFDKFRYIYGTVYDKFDNMFSIVLKEPSENILPSDYFNFKTDSNTIVYDVKEEEAYKGSSSDLYSYMSSDGENYSRVFIQTNIGEPQTVIIYNP